MQAIVRLRGEVDTTGPIRDTLSMLNVHRVNHATLVPETDAYRGMIAKVNDYVAFGEPSADVVATLLDRRGETADGDDVTDEWVAEHTGYDDVTALAEGLLAEETTLQDAGLSPTLRLHPPRGGHDGIKNPVADGGDLGRHDTASIDDLLTAMR
ncbi:MAG: 50S ribosomal protein L30 [Halobacteriaceae archaeon]